MLYFIILSKLKKKFFRRNLTNKLNEYHSNYTKKKSLINYNLFET